MGILDNSGDIILDIVLTDLGRKRLSEANGRFQINKYAFSDDEINYGFYSGSHPSGSDYYDLNIMNSFVFEALTNNASVMNSKLISNPRNDLLYLPVLKANELNSSTERYTTNSSASWVVTSDKATEDKYNGLRQPPGILYGFNVASGVIEQPGRGNAGGNYIRIDQGLDTSELSPTSPLDKDLVESQYTIRIDNRLGKICDVAGNQAQIMYIDDDDIATYIVNLGTDPQFVKQNSSVIVGGTECISGPRGTILQFKIKASTQLVENNYYLFNLLGSTTTVATAGAVKYIDTYVRIEGGTTGYKLDIPVKFIKV